MPTALVRRPGPDLANGLLTHRQRVPVDVALAARQWADYVDAMRSAGWEIVEVEAADECPDAVFVEDAIVVFDEIAIITRPGATTRRAETTGAAATAGSLGLDLRHIAGPATLDGGDVLKVGRVAYVGVGGRTDADAVEQLREILGPEGWGVVAVPVTKVLHLKSAVTALPDGTVIGFPALVDDADVFERFMPVPEPAGAHVVLLGGGRLLMSSDAPATAEHFGSMGFEPVVVDISEFEKLEGCVTCLSVRLRHL
jgi:dimethylargininase